MEFANQITMEAKVYFIGGYDHSTSSHTDKVYIFDPDTVTVSQIGVLKNPVYDSVLILFNYQ